MSQPAGPKPPMSRKKLAIGAAVVVCAPVFIAGMVAGAKDSMKTQASGTPSPIGQVSTTAPVPAGSGNAAPQPTFSYPGDKQCQITYRDRGDGTMSWTATVTVSGQLITHAADKAGHIYRHVTNVRPGATSFSAPVPLAQVDDIGGNLDGSRSYGCSVRPAG